jgi:dihydroneopterin aldolase/2-amino-4-hydroxy-6-hydroxymethyldihydropteridine diphosphokinase
LLKKIKQLEGEAGRSGGLFWGPRPLDIDIIDYKSKIMNWPVRSKKITKRKAYGAEKTSSLTLPHLQMHKRVFVLQPLKEIAPTWRHPIYGKTADILMKQYCSPLDVKSLEKLDISLDL